MVYFDYESTANEARIAEATLARWREIFRREYPGDEMMVELRLLRACDAVRSGLEQQEDVDEALSAEDSRVQ